MCSVGLKIKRKEGKRAEMRGAAERNGSRAAAFRWLSDSRHAACHWSAFIMAQATLSRSLSI